MTRAQRLKIEQKTIATFKAKQDANLAATEGQLTKLKDLHKTSNDQHSAALELIRSCNEQLLNGELSRDAVASLAQSIFDLKAAATSQALLNTDMARKIEVVEAAIAYQRHNLLAA